VFNYWFAFPAITFPLKSYSVTKTQNFTDVFTKDQSEKIITSLSQFQEKQAKNQTYFALDYETMRVLSVAEGIENFNLEKRVVFAYYDPNSQSNHPGWPLRNYLALLSLKW
jgi:ubiquitin-like modifier-activating enzyme ATG7